MRPPISDAIAGTILVSVACCRPKDEVKPITVEQGPSVGAFARVPPRRVNVGANAIVTLGSLLLKGAQPNGIYTGNPAALVGTRAIRDRSGLAAGGQS